MQHGHYTIVVGVRLAAPLPIENEQSPACGFFQTIETSSPSLGDAIRVTESAILAGSQWSAFGGDTGWIDRVEIDCVYGEDSLGDSGGAPHISGRVYYTDDVEKPARKWWKLW